MARFSKKHSIGARSISGALLVSLMAGSAMAAPPSMGAPVASSGSNSKTVAVLPPTGQGTLPPPFPSGVVGNPATPLSSQKMTVSGDKIDAQVAQTVKDADERLSGVNIGTGPMKVDALPVVTLREDIAYEARMHQLQQKTDEVSSSVGLWKSAYDGKREQEQSTSQAASEKAATETKVTQPVKSEEDAVEQREKEAKAAAEKVRLAAEAEAARQKLIAQEITSRKKAMGNVPPVISSIFGPTANPTATILIPYVGVRNVVVGDTITLIDGSKMKVIEIKDGMLVSHNGGPSQPLSFGSSVPTRQDAIATLNEVFEANSKTEKNAPAPSSQGTTFPVAPGSVPNHH